VRSIKLSYCRHCTSYHSFSRRANRTEDGAASGSGRIILRRRRPAGRQ